MERPPAPDLSRRQRTIAPVDRWSARRGEAGGGYEWAQPMTLAPGMEDDLARYPGTVYDGQIRRDRGPWMHQEMYLPPGNGWVNWTAAGAVRPELHMRNSTLRTMVGNTQSRYPVVDTPTTGLHTNLAPGVARTVGRYVTTPQMVATRQFRLLPGQYSGQTYSQTTKLQGGRR